MGPPVLQRFRRFAIPPMCLRAVLGPNYIVAGNFDDSVIEVLKANTDVEYIAEDGIVQTFVDQYVELLSPVGTRYSNPHARNGAPWNLARVSTRSWPANQDPFSSNYTYSYLPSPGSGVDIYVVDTGLFFVHFRPEIISTSTSKGIFVSHVREPCSNALQRS